MVSAVLPIVETDVPPRLDRLPWARFHSLVVVALGITWILDGLEVTLVGSVAGALQASPRAASQRHRDRPRRQRLSRPARCSARCSSAGSPTASAASRLFFVTLGRLSGRRRRRPASPGISPASSLFRFLTGAGIGGEYAAINSAIQELIPARCRGRTDLAINGSFWIGAALGALRLAGAARSRRSSPPIWAGALAFVIGARARAW